jgi:hypothetical protein
VKLQAALSLLEAVIAGEAKQSRMLNSVLTGVLRRFAPRNDDTFVKP